MMNPEDLKKISYRYLSMFNDRSESPEVECIRDLVASHREALHLLETFASYMLEIHSRADIALRSDNHATTTRQLDAIRERALFGSDMYPPQEDSDA